MTGNESLSPTQHRFLQVVVAGMSIIDAANHAGISESTAHRWLKNPVFQAELERRQTAIREAAEAAEKAEIERIMTTGYAAVHNRVQALDRMAQTIEKSWQDPSNPEKIVFQWMRADRIKEWRGCLEDIAAELSQRIRVTKSDVTSAGEKLDGQQVIFYMPEVDKEEDGSDGNHA